MKKTIRLSVLPPLLGDANSWLGVSEVPKAAPAPAANLCSISLRFNMFIMPHEVGWGPVLKSAVTSLKSKSASWQVRVHILTGLSDRFTLESPRLKLLHAVITLPN